MRKSAKNDPKTEKKDTARNLAIIGIILVVLVALLILAFGMLFGGNSAGKTSNPETTEQNRANFNELRAMSEMIRGLEFKAEYTVTYDPMVSKDSSFHTYYAKSGNFRIDVMESNITLQMYKIGTNTYACSEENLTMACIFVGDVEDLGTGSTLDDIEANLGNYDISISEDRKILGMDAKCFSIDVNDLANSFASGYSALGNGANMTIVNCFSKDGIPLEASSMFSKMELTSISRSVPDSAFVLPSEPVLMNETD